MTERYPSVNQLKMLQNAWHRQPDFGTQPQSSLLAQPTGSQAASNNPFAPTASGPNSHVPRVMQQSTGLHQQQTGLYQQPTGLYQQQTGLYQQQTGLYQQPTGLQPLPTGLYQQPTGLQPLPTGLYQQPTGLQPMATGLQPLPTGWAPQGGQWGNPSGAVQSQPQPQPAYGQRGPLDGQALTMVPTVTGMNGYAGVRVPTHAQAQAATTARNGVSAFDPYAPAGGSGISPGADMQVPSLQSTIKTPAQSSSSPSQAIFKTNWDKWVQANLSNRRRELGPPIKPPKNFVESYRQVLDQAFENILNAIALNNKADVSTSFEACSAAQSVREMLFRDQGEFGLDKKLGLVSSQAASRRLGEDVRRALYMLRDAPWASFDDIVDDTVNGLRSIFPY